MVWCFTLEASDFQSQLSFLRLFFGFWFLIFSIFVCKLFPETDRFRTVGIKRWKNILFQKAIFPSFFFFTSYHLIESFFDYVFSVLHCQNSCWASRIWNTWSSPFYSTFLFCQKKCIFYVLSEFNEAIFNVSTLGQLSDLFLLLFFAPYHCWNIDVMQCLSQFAALFSLPYRSLFRHGFWAGFC